MKTFKPILFLFLVFSLGLSAQTEKKQEDPKKKEPPKGGSNLAISNQGLPSKGTKGTTTGSNKKTIDTKPEGKKEEKTEHNPKGNK